MSQSLFESIALNNCMYPTTEIEMVILAVAFVIALTCNLLYEAVYLWCGCGRTSVWVSVVGTVMIIFSL